MPNILIGPEYEFEDELQALDKDVDETVQCFYIWRTVHAEARKSRKIFDFLNQHAEFWVVALGSIQANSLIAIGRIFDKDNRSHSIGRLLRLVEKNQAIFSREALRLRKTRVPVNNHLIGNFMKDVKEPTPQDFARLRSFVERRRKVYERCYKQLRDKWYAHKDLGNIGGNVGNTSIGELGRLVSDLRNLHDMLWQWYQNGQRPRSAHLRRTVGTDICRETREFLHSLTS